MKRLLILCLVLLNLSAFGQTTESADRIVARQSLFVRDWWVDSIARDTNFLNKTRAVPTAETVKRFVEGRLAAFTPSGTGIDSVKLEAGELKTYKGATPTTVTRVARYNFTALQDGDLIKAQISGTDTTFVNFTPAYADQAALRDSVTLLRDSLAALRADIGAGGPSAGTTIPRQATAPTGDTLIYFNTLTHALGIQNDEGTQWLYFTASDSTAIATGGGAYDADAEAYFTAQGITSTAEKNAVNDFIVATKAGANAWSRIKGLYFFLGTGLKNAKTPGTFDLTTTSAGTTPTIGATGSVADGTDDYWNTGITPSTHLGADDEGFAVYVKASTDDKCVMGAIGGTNSYLYPRSGGAFTYAHQQGGDNSGGANASAAGTYVTSHRNASGSYYKRAIKDGAQLHTVSGASGSTAATQAIYLHANNINGAGGAFNASTLGMAAVTLGLTDTQASELSTAIQNFITALSRN